MASSVTPGLYWKRWKKKKKKKSKREKRKKEKKRNEESSYEEESKIERRCSKISKSSKLKKKRERNADTSESDEEESPLQKKSKVEKQERESVEAQFHFYKVSKFMPTKEFVTVMRSPVHLTLDALKKELLATQIGGLDVFTKDASVWHICLHSNGGKSLQQTLWNSGRLWAASC